MPGLGGDFVYLRTRRIADTDVIYDLDPNALWILLQLRHGRALRPFDQSTALQLSRPPADDVEAPTIAYLPQATESALAELRALKGAVLAFTPTPGLLRDAADRPGLAIEGVPDRWLAEFPRNVVGL